MHHMNDEKVPFPRQLSFFKENEHITLYLFVPGLHVPSYKLMVHGSSSPPHPPPENSDILLLPPKVFPCSSLVIPFPHLFSPLPPHPFFLSTPPRMLLYSDLWLM